MIATPKILFVVLNVAGLLGLLVGLSFAALSQVIGTGPHMRSGALRRARRR